MVSFDIDPMGAVRYVQGAAWRPDWQRYCEYKHDLAWLAKAERYEITVPLSLAFTIAMPKSWSEKKKREMDGMPHESAPDLDNLIKGFKDALLQQDAGVWWYGPMEKRWGYAGKITVRDG